MISEMEIWLLILVPPEKLHSELAEITFGLFLATKKNNTFHSSAWTITHFAHWWIIRKNIPDTINRLKKLYPLLIDTTFISSDIELLNYFQVLISDETMISSPLARLFWRHFIMNNYILNTIIKWIASIYTRLLIIFTLIYRCIHIISSYQLI